MARSLNGSSDKILVSSGLVSGRPLTLSCWVNLVTLAPAADYVILGVQNSAVNIYALIYFTKSGTHLQGNCQGGTVFSSTTVISANTWYHACLTVDGSGNGAIYTNGGGVGTLTALMTNATAPTEATIGFFDNAGTSANFVNGSIADAACWNIALSTAEISALANGARPNTIRPTALVGWWPLDGLQSPEPDLSGAAHNGTLTGTALAAGPPLMRFTPRWPQIIPTPAAAAPTVTFQPAWAMQKNIIIEGFAT